LESEDEDGSGRSLQRKYSREKLPHNFSIQISKGQFEQVRRLLIESRLLKRESFEAVFKEFTDEKLAEYLTEESKIGLFAIENGRIVGFLLGEDEDSVGYLTWLVLDKIQRGKGIGSKLTCAFEEWLKERGITKVYADVSPDNSSTLHFYEKNGFIKEAYLKKHWYKEDCFIYSKFI